MLYKLIVISLLTLVILSCSVEPKAIEYGTDACSFCKMTIVDRQHAAELVSKKGKVFKYDAIECMIRDLKRNRSVSEIAFFLIADFTGKGEFTDAQKATYLISNNIPSPMGANLSGFKDKNAAEKIKNMESGELFSWTELLERF